MLLHKYKIADCHADEGSISRFDVKDASSLPRINRDRQHDRARLKRKLKIYVKELYQFFLLRGKRRKKDQGENTSLFRLFFSFELLALLPRRREEQRDSGESL
jgi:hypothetical protein